MMRESFGFDGKSPLKRGLENSPTPRYEYVAPQPISVSESVEALNIVDDPEPLNSLIASPQSTAAPDPAMLSAMPAPHDVGSVGTALVAAKVFDWSTWLLTGEAMLTAALIRLGWPAVKELGGNIKDFGKDFGKNFKATFITGPLNDFKKKLIPGFMLDIFSGSGSGSAEKPKAASHDGHGGGHGH